MAAAIQQFEPLAIVGMDAAWAGCDGLEAFERLVYEMRQQFARADRPLGNSSPAGEPLLGKVVRRALRDAGINVDNPRQRIAALASSGGPLAPRWEWAVSFEDLPGEPEPLVSALQRAQAILQNGAADLVVFAAGAGQLRVEDEALEVPVPLVLDSIPPLCIDNGALGFDRAVHGLRLGEGAGAVVLMLADRAKCEGRRAYAVIRSVASASGNDAGGSPLAAWLPPALEVVRGCCRAALDIAGVSARQVGYIEAFASGIDALDGVEIAGLAQTYRQPASAPRDQDLTTAIGSVQSNAGYLGAAAGLAGLVRAALCLYHRVIPGGPGWSAPKLPALWRGAPFYVPGESRAWFQKAGGAGRLAGLNVFGRDGSFAHLVLGEAARLAGEQPRPAAHNVLYRGGFYLFPLAGESAAGLLEQLLDLRQALTGAADLNDLAAEVYNAAQENPSAPFGLAIVGHDHEEIRREIEYALAALPPAAPGSEWQTPLGSYFTSAPAGQLGGVALVYPGAFNSYPGVGRDLFRLFPNLHEQTAPVTGDLGGVIRERLLYPRSLAAISKEEMASIEARLLADPVAMLISGTTLAILYTRILQTAFKIHPRAAFGYSLGENSMLYAAGVWGQGDAAAARLEESQVFRARLAGSQLAIREHWGLPVGETIPGQRLWSNHLVMAAPEKVQAVLAREPRAYLTHINTPRQVVIGGDPQACQRVLDALRCPSLQAPFDSALHCAVMRSEFDALAELHDWPVESVPAMQMFSAADYAPLRVEQNAASQSEISRAISHMLTSPLDFPRLVEQVYAGGSRVYIEAGAGGNCARWVAETLKGRPHLAISMNRRGTDDYTNLVRTLARLYSHRVPMDLSPLYTSLTDKRLNHAP